MVTSTFDTGTDGWTSTNGTEVWNATYGFDGGGLQASEGGTGTFWYEAGANYLGDLSDYWGGSLSFDLRREADNSEPGLAPDVTISGGGLTMYYDVAADPTDTWSTTTIDFTSIGGWTIAGVNRLATMAEIQQILASVTEFRIRGEYVVGSVNDISYLDNVVVAESTAPPEFIGSNVGSTFNNDTDGWGSPATSFPLPNPTANSLRSMPPQAEPSISRLRTNIWATKKAITADGCNIPSTSMNRPIWLTWTMWF
ncbi:MAG: hypothetical protein GY947_05620 [Rhodobacteraceae bacterium]|nr:hypothetical protein [Paracoccaceae bacterium]